MILLLRLLLHRDVKLCLGWGFGVLDIMTMGGELLFLCALCDGVYGLFEVLLIKIWLDTG